MNYDKPRLPILPFLPWIRVSLGNVHEECKTSVIQAYMEKYIIDPEVTIIMDGCRQVGRPRGLSLCYQDLADSKGHAQQAM